MHADSKNKLVVISGLRGGVCDESNRRSKFIREVFAESVLRGSSYNQEGR